MFPETLTKKKTTFSSSFFGGKFDHEHCIPCQSIKRRCHVAVKWYKARAKRTFDGKKEHLSHSFVFMFSSEKCYLWYHDIPKYQQILIFGVIWSFNYLLRSNLVLVYNDYAFISQRHCRLTRAMLSWELKKTTTVTGTSLNKKNKGLKSRKMAVHVRYNSWYISLSSPTKHQREMTKFCVFWRTWTTADNF